MARRLALACIAVFLVAAACGSSREAVTGVVVEVDGTITSVSRFVVVAEDGERFVFVPASGISFHGGAPIGHLQEHLRSGAAVVVRFEQLDDGTLVAVEVIDG